MHHAILLTALQISILHGKVSSPSVPLLEELQGESLFLSSWLRIHFPPRNTDSLGGLL